jgi:hypothetical protein
MKTCRRCSNEKPASDFGSNSRMKDGLRSWCRECDRTYALEWRRQNRERYLKSGRAWKAANQDRQLEYKRRHRALNHQKEYARGKVAAEVKAGRLVPLPCTRCSATPTEAHHPDYSKPLDVIWLCRPCHLQEHGASCAAELDLPIAR